VSLHADALGTLRSWPAPDDTQAALRDRFVTHLETNEDGVFRGCVPDHVTASALVLSDDLSQVLLTLHAKAQRWFQFGGHLEPGDATLLAAATREAAEESGLAGLVLDPVPVQLSEHAVPFCGGTVLPGGRSVRHLDVRFVAVAPAGAAFAVSDESLDVRWWPADELPDPQPDLIDLVALARRRLDLRSR